MVQQQGADPLYLPQRRPKLCLLEPEVPLLVSHPDQLMEIDSVGVHQASLAKREQVQCSEKGLTTSRAGNKRFDERPGTTNAFVPILDQGVSGNSVAIPMSYEKLNGSTIGF